MNRTALARTASAGAAFRRVGVLMVALSLTLAATLLADMKLRAADLPTARPEDVGLSTERLARIGQMMKRHIDAGHIQGGVTAIARRGKVAHFEAYGLMDIEAQRPMTTDAIFRMASSTKPVTGVAILMLVEEGKVRLSDPVHNFIPEFKGMKVAVPKAGTATSDAPPSAGQQSGTAEYDTVEANHEITIRDLLTHTSGLVTGGLGSAAARQIQRTGDTTLADYIPKLGAVPLDFQPGTAWRYSPGAGIDTLARIVEIASGQSFDQFLRVRIFEPLGMSDTFFALPDDRQSRLVTLYRATPNGLEKSPLQSGFSSRKYFSGAGGLMSTAGDYLRFEQMLLNRGQLNGNRLLGPRTVELMATNHVGDLFAGLAAGQKGMGFGFTVAVVLDPAKAESRRSNGAFGWGGAFGTISWTDPKEQMCAVLMLQQRDQQVQRDFENAVMQAIVD
jgi:CubicO group peptidase (beta-lactamase class C family)